MKDSMNENKRINALEAKIASLSKKTKSLPVPMDRRNYISTGQVSEPRAGGKLASKLQTVCPEVPEYSKGWLMSHLNPCGEAKTQLDWGKVPDGAIPMSAAGELRQVLTLRRPGSVVNNVPLDGGMWALCLFHLPLFRTPLLAVASLDRSEVQTSDLDRVLADWNNRQDFEPATAPNWEGVGDGVYYTIVQWSGLEGVTPPTSLGVSSTLSEYRITSDGMTMFFNTPTLINQGIVVGAQFNADSETETVDPLIENGTFLTSLFMSLFSDSAALGNASLQVSIPGLPSTTVEVGGTVPNGTIVLTGTANASFESTTGPSQSWDVGDTLGLVKLSEFSPTINMQIEVNGTPGPAIAFIRPNSSFTQIGESSVPRDLGVRVNSCAFPPVTQEELTQATPKTVQYLLQESRGAYMVKRLFQPVMSMAKATSYGPVRWKTINTTNGQFAAALGGLPDSFDLNYGIGVMNISSLPNAAQPFIKLMRKFEAIPAAKSPWGPFATSTTPKDELVLEVARCVHDEDPFMYPESYNSFGFLFDKIFKVITRLPLYARNAATITKAVSECVESVNDVLEGGNSSKMIKGQRVRVV
nr:MAG: RNA-dependent RNA polymerase [Riboviria sp.]